MKGYKSNLKGEEDKVLAELLINNLNKTEKKVRLVY